MRKLVVLLALMMASCSGSYTMMSYNIRNCIGIDDSTDIQRTASVLKEADFIALQEIDSVTGRSGGKYILGELASLLGLNPVFAPAIDYDGGKYGIGLLSKQKPLSWRSIPLPGREEARVLLVVEFKRFYLCTAHFSLNNEDRIRSAMIVDSVVKSLDKPLIFAGDLNAEPQSEEIKYLSDRMEMLCGGICSWPADCPREAIDYIFGIGIECLDAKVIDESYASDHRPLMIKFK